MPAILLAVALLPLFLHGARCTTVPSLLSQLSSALSTSAVPTLSTSSISLSSSLTSSNSTTAPSSTTSITLPTSSSFVGSSGNVSSRTTSSLTSGSSVTGTSTTSSATQPSRTIDPGALADIETIRERRISIVVTEVGSPANISDWVSTFTSDGTWPDVDYTTGCDAQRANWPAEVHWNRTTIMAAAWHGGLLGAESYVNSSTLLDTVSRAMDYWFDNDLTDISCLDAGGLADCPCGTPGLWNTNWFSNIIGVPEFVGETCLLLGTDTLTPTQLSNCTNILNRSFATFDRVLNDVGTLTGANTLDVAKIGIDGGLLVDNATQVASGYQHIHDEVIVQNATRADGIRADGSFGQHAGIIYNGNYGWVYSNDVLALEIAGAGTEFSAQTAAPDSLGAFETLMDGDLWMIYRNVITNVLHWDFSVLPRFITFPVSDEQATGSINMNISQIQELGELWGSDTLNSVYESLAMSTEDANSGKIVGNRMFYDNDYMAQRGSGYVSTLRMYSNRTRNTECTNSQNPFGFHLSDGTLYTYLQGDEYEDIAAAWDWNLIPGITTDYAATNLSCSATGFTGVQAFVGGATDGSVGAAAMRYTNPYTGTLSFQKAWFFLDDDVQHIMISSASSNASAAHPVISVLDQKRLNGPVYIDGKALTKGGNFSHPKSLWHDSVGYTFDYALLDPRFDLAVDFGARSGDWATIGISTVGEITVDLFSAWINHGSGPFLDVPVAYTAYPATSLEEFESKSANAGAIRTVRNDKDVSAVFDATHRTAMVVFWDAAGGSVTILPSLTDAPITIAASGNSIVMYKLDEGKLTVSNPSQTLESVEVTLILGLLGVRPKGWGAQSIKKFDVALPTDGLGGMSVTETF